MITGALITIMLPTMAFVVQLFFGRRLPRQGDWLPVGAMLAAILPALYVLLQAIALGDPGLRLERNWEWVVAGQFSLPVGILVDNVTAMMLVVVTVVSGLVHLFSIGYMAGDPLYSRYFAYLSLFSMSMLGLVLSNNLLLLYVFWELVGLSSYLLIGFWFSRPAAAAAAKKAFIVTRIGDVGMFIGILAIYGTTGSLNYGEAFAAVAAGTLSGTLLTLAGLGLFSGAVGKSAQFPLHVWLPDAMEGPTPVSALIHAATMVAAGVYMVARLYLLFSPDALLVIAYVGSFTALFAATIAITTTDIKRTMAYSTVSQLGYMMMGLGVGGFTAGLFHLWTHAYFKALLFLSAGSIIHSLHTQEMWEMGGLRQKMPVTFVTFTAGGLALAGFPFFSGFYSKDAILTKALEFARESPVHFLPFLFGAIGVAVTAFYIFKMLFVVFFGEPRDRESYHHAHESPLVMALPLVLLALLSLSSGWGGWFEELIKKPELSAFGRGGVEAASLSGQVPAEAEGSLAHGIIVVLSVAMLAVGAAISYFLYFRKVIDPGTIATRFRRLHRTLVSKYFLDEVYGFAVVGTVLLSTRIVDWFDMVIIDGAVNGVAWVTKVVAFAEGLFDNLVVDGAVNGTATVVMQAGSTLRRVQTGRLQDYFALVLVGIFVIFILSVL